MARNKKHEKQNKKHKKQKNNPQWISIFSCQNLVETLWATSKQVCKQSKKRKTKTKTTHRRTGLN